MRILYSADVCPFAQRTRALCARIELAHELRTVDLEDRDPSFLALSPTGRVPLLVDGDLVLYESRIINEYLAEQAGWTRAWDRDPARRARQRLAMERWDAVVNRAFYRALSGAEPDADGRVRLAGELAQLAETVAASPDADGLLGLHVAPFWARIRWLEELAPLRREIRRPAALERFLDRAADLECVRATLPDRAATVARYRARYAGR